ncbi:MAG: peptide chain release factor N(5)-glutamine methyltransferase [Paludibacteraceae bacterium]|nr:peptide chain release factor N(5)-glutamine methyltransferase [Paludibacteraceae bacterium]
MKELIIHITSLLLPCYPEDEARSLAWWIVEEETGLSRSQILCGCKGTTFSPHMQEVVDRLLHFEPIQYIFGHTLWGGLDLKLTPATLTPRPETAELVELVNQSFNRQPSNRQWNVLDVGTGSGCIAIAIKKAHPEWQVTGIDISAEAIEIAKENARRNNVEVDFQVADIFSDECEAFYTSLHTPYTLIISNPPYIRESEKVSMKPNVLNFEPSTALFVSDTDPLKFYRRIAELLSCTPYTSHHTPKYLFFEINEAFPQELAAMLEQLGYTDIQISNDIYGKPRIIQGRMA